MTKEDFNEGLLGFLDASPTPFHATKNMAMMFENAGFTRIFETQKWDLKAGEKYYVTRSDSSIIAFTYPEDRGKYLMMGTHNDFPTMKIKPNPAVKEGGVVKLGVESYGSALLNTWFDRPLSIAGKISYRTKGGNISESIVDAKTALCTIPSLAIHLNKDANKCNEINKQTDLYPVISDDESFEFDEFLHETLKQNGVSDAEEIYAHDLSLYSVEKASFFGYKKEFISSGKIDNLLSCYCAMLTLCSAKSSDAVLFVANNHEEVGSQSTGGADGSFLRDVLRRMFGDYEEYMMMIRSSMMVSIDNAHAVHPNFTSKHDANHLPYINKGVVVKINANQRYATSSTTTAKFMDTSYRVGESVQSFVSRGDMPCGSTIGPITASKLGIDTIDVGVPTYAMHSINEVCGSDDAYSLFKILIELCK